MKVAESDEAGLVLPARAFHLLGMFDRLRERLMPLEDASWLDIPRH
jgi:hypothetical protein